jgi:octaprenyl-diphosphate synthase
LAKSLNNIKEPLKEDLKKYNKFLKNTVRSNTPLLNTILKYILKRKGKQIRPILVLLSAGLHGRINEKTYRGAALIELLHTATLVHDDVVDDSYQRRGLLSINALWKNKMAVLAGDYLLSRGMILALENEDYTMLQISSEAVKKMSEGEILQLSKSRSMDIDKDIYFRIIRNKTASLISTACALGTASVSKDEEVIQTMKMIGEYLGIAFQIKDDIMDFTEVNSGKPRGNDLKEKKITLPLIHCLEEAPAKESKKIIRLISQKNKNAFATVYDFIVKYHGFHFAEKQMKEYSDKALALLKKFEKNTCQDAMEALIHFNMDRNK